ncbi:MAG: DUF6089 family protein [Crocinitomicaceae bacterium]|nr:DUF6089 family protein [Crocinitomicaceae bacterium]
MKFLVAILLFTVSLTAQAQGGYHTNASKSELGIMGGVTYYIGDLNSFGHFRNSHIAGSLIYRYNVNARWAVRANFMYGRLSADDSQANDPIKKSRNLNFNTDIYELAVGVEFNYFPFQLGHDRYKGTAYILAEIGVFRMNPKTMYNGTEMELQPLGTEGQGTSLNTRKHYSLTQFTIPLGVGARVSLGERVGLNFEFGIRKTFTDYIDDVGSDSYVDPDILAEESGPIVAELSNQSGERYGPRGNSATKDWYAFAGIGFTFRLGKPSRCPPGQGR